MSTDYTGYIRLEIFSSAFRLYGSLMTAEDMPLVKSVICIPPPTDAVIIDSAILLLMKFFYSLL